jgi:uncharacterized sulfatase
MMREYLASTASVDRNLGRLLAVLEELKLSGRTIVIFTSDHGYNMGHNGIWHKGNGRWILTHRRGSRPNLYDHSLRVPMIIRWPGTVKPGTIVKKNVSTLDLYPTILAMAGLAVPEGVKIHGRDFVPLLKGEDIPWDEELFAQYSMIHGQTADLRMWRTNEWKLVRNFYRKKRPVELFHLATDPEEHKNLADSNDPEVQAMRARLNAKLLEKMRAIGDPLTPGGQPGADH